MAEKFIIKFSKSGYAKYTSHLDLLRFFKRAFRKSGVALKYSQGFNPHPKLGFAQPLSLGYSSSCELLEFETADNLNAEDICEAITKEMPEGLEIQWCREAPGLDKPLASVCESAEYQVTIPYSADTEFLNHVKNGYLEQESITALKRRKKDKKMVETDIKAKIRRFEVRALGENTVLDMELDSGSVSNCSPELVISSFCSYAGIDTPRYDMEVERMSLKFYNNLQF